MRRLAVFCGSNPGFDPAYGEAARAMGALLAARGIELVYGGGRVGVMGILADAVLAGGGHVIGVIPEAIEAAEVAHRGLQDLRVVKTMHERKALMADLSDAFVALPGGCGTLDEWFEAVTWNQLGIHRKPCGLLNVAGYFDGLIAFLDHARDQGFLRREHRDALVHDADPATLLDRLAAVRLPDVGPWLDRETR
jgi:uncharacterized protein (TIGR00730 family)